MEGGRAGKSRRAVRKVSFRGLQITRLWVRQIFTSRPRQSRVIYKRYSSDLQKDCSRTFTVSGNGFNLFSGLHICIIHHKPFTGKCAALKLKCLWWAWSRCNCLINASIPTDCTRRCKSSLAILQALYSMGWGNHQRHMACRLHPKWWGACVEENLLSLLGFCRNMKRKMRFILDPIL